MMCLTVHEIAAVTWEGAALVGTHVLLVCTLSASGTAVITTIVRAKASAHEAVRRIRGAPQLLQLQYLLRIC